jgi:hypothetical protein
MSDVNLNLVVQPVETNITINSNELSVTPTAIDLTLSTTNAGSANIVFDVNPATSNLVITTNDISFTPSAVNMQVYGGGLGVPGGNTTTVQFNNGGQLGGIPNVTYSSGNLNLGSIGNIKIPGGSANYVLKTDGTGNLSWGTPVVAGANTTVQYNNNGAIAGSGNLTFNNTSNTLSVTNIKVGAYYYANGQPLNLSNTYSNSNVAAFLFNSGLFTGAVNNIQTTGSTLTTSNAAATGREAFSSVNQIAGVVGTIVQGFTSDGTYIYGCLRNFIVRSTDGQNWSIVYTGGAVNFVSMAFNGTYLVAVGTSGSLVYSTSGTSWSTNTVGVNNWLRVITSGSTFLMCGASGIYTSTNPLTWTQRNATAVLDMARAGSLVVAITATAGVYSTNTTTWNNITPGTFTSAARINTDGTNLVVSRSGIGGNFWRSTNATSWTSFTITISLTPLTGTLLYSASIGQWYLRSTAYGGLVEDVISTDFINWSYRNIVYLGQEPGNNAITEDYTISNINLIAVSGLPSMRKIPQNLIYQNLATMSTAPVGNYICLGPVSTNFDQSLYMWLTTT